MRRNDREVTDINEIFDILNRCDTVRLGASGNECPYIVPLSFGLEMDADGRITLFFHGAKEGLKHELIKKANTVCIEADILHRYVNTGHSITCEYESVIGSGTAKIVTGDEAKRGLDRILAHCGYTGYEYDTKILNAVLIYGVTLETVTGKRNLV